MSPTSAPHPTAFPVTTMLSKTLLPALTMLLLAVGVALPAATANNPEELSVTIDHVYVDGTAITVAAPGQTIEYQKTHEGPDDSSSWFEIVTGGGLVTDFDAAPASGAEVTNSGDCTVAQQCHGTFQIQAKATCEDGEAESQIKSVEITEFITVTVDRDYVVIGRANEAAFTITGTIHGYDWPAVDVIWEHRRRDVGGAFGAWTAFAVGDEVFVGSTVSGTFTPAECGEYDFRLRLGEQDHYGHAYGEVAKQPIAFPEITSITVTDRAHPANTITYAPQDSLYLFNREDGKEVDVSVTTAPAARAGTDRYLRFRAEGCGPAPRTGDFAGQAATTFAPGDGDHEAHIFYGIDLNRDGTLAEASEQIDYVYVWFIRLVSLTVKDELGGESATNPNDDEVEVMVRDGRLSLEIGAVIEGGSGDEGSRCFWRVMGKVGAVTSSDFSTNPIGGVSFAKTGGPFRVQAAEDRNHDGAIQDDEVVYTIRLVMFSDIKAWDAQGRQVTSSDGKTLKVVSREGASGVVGTEEVHFAFTDPDIDFDPLSAQWTVTKNGAVIALWEGPGGFFTADSPGWGLPRRVLGMIFNWCEDGGAHEYRVSVSSGSRQLSIPVRSFMAEYQRLDVVLNNENLLNLPSADQLKYIRMVMELHALKNRLATLAYLGPVQIDFEKDFNLLVRLNNQMEEDPAPDTVWRNWDLTLRGQGKVEVKAKAYFPIHPAVPSAIARIYVFLKAEAKASLGGGWACESGAGGGVITFEGEAKLGGGVGVDLLSGFCDVQGGIQVGADISARPVLTDAPTHHGVCDYKIDVGAVELFYEVSLAWGVVEYEDTVRLTGPLATWSSDGDMITTATYPGGPARY